MTPRAVTTTKGPDTYVQLRALIVGGLYRSGQRLSERELAVQLSVSRTPVREALRQLVQEGVVTYEPRRGYRVARISHEQARHLFAVREVIEPLAARLAADHAPSQLFEAMGASLAQARAAYRQGSLGGLIAANQSFHRLLSQASGNPYVISIFDKLQAHIALMMSRSLSWPRRPEETFHEHERLLAALGRRDATAAERLAREHVRRAFKGYLRNLPADGS